MQQNQGNMLKNICGYSFPGNSLLQFSLVHQPQEQTYKKEYFFFLTCAPGEQGQGGGRTFNFQNRFTIKMDIDKIAALRHALILYSTGRKNIIGNFSIFADGSKSNFGSGGQTKSIYLNDGQDKNGNPIVSLMFKVGQNKGFPYIMPIANALAVADILEGMVNRGMELEFKRSNIQLQPSTIKSNGGNNYNNQPQNIPQNNMNQQSPQNNMNHPLPGNIQPPPNTQQNVANNFATTLQNIGNINQ